MRGKEECKEVDETQETQPATQMKDRHKTTHRKTGTEVAAGERENENTEGKLQEKIQTQSKAAN